MLFSKVGYFQCCLFLLQRGDDLYSSSAKGKVMPTNGYMHPSSVNKQIPLNNKVCGEYCPTFDSVLFGNTSNLFTEEESLSLELKDGLCQFFNNHNFGLFTCDGYTTGMMQVGHDFWIFDSHSRDTHGMIHGNGKAVLINFSSIDEIVGYLKALYGSNKQYEIYVVAGHLQDLHTSKRPEGFLNLGAFIQRPEISLSLGATSDKCENTLNLGAPCQRPESSVLSCDSSNKFEKSLDVGAASYQRPEMLTSIATLSEQSEKLSNPTNSQQYESFLNVDAASCQQPEMSTSLGIPSERLEKLPNTTNSQQYENSHLLNVSLEQPKNSLADCISSKQTVDKTSYGKKSNFNTPKNLSKREKRKLILGNARETKLKKSCIELCGVESNKNLIVNSTEQINDVELNLQHEKNIVRCTRSNTKVLQTNVKVGNDRKEYYKEKYKFNDFRKKQIQTYSKEHHKQNCNDPKYKNKKVIITKRKLENDEQYRVRNLQNVKARLETDDEYRIRNLQNVKARLEDDDEYRNRNLQNANERYHNKIQSNEILYEQFQASSRKSKEKSQRCMTDDQKRQKMYEQYYNAIKEGPSHVCVCCGQINFKKNVFEYDVQSYKLKYKFDLKNIASSLTTSSSFLICNTCHNYLKTKRIPANALVNGLSFPIVPEELQGLTLLEERLLAVRQPFMKIQELDRYVGGQYGIKGSCVNVPTDINATVTVLPRNIAETQTILVKLQKRMSDKSPYMYELVRPHKVFKAAQYLCQTKIYQKHNIKLNENWVTENENSLVHSCVEIGNSTIGSDSIVGTERIISDKTNIQKDTNEHEQSSEDSDSDTPDTDPQDLVCSENNENFDKNLFDAILNLSPYQSEESENENDELLHESLIIPEYVDDSIPDNSGIIIAPGENHQPISLLRDEDMDVLSFPTIYCGEPRNFKFQLTDAQLRKFEIRNHDRRVAKNIPRLFVSFCKSRLQKLVSRIQIALRKKKNIKSLTVSDLITSEGLESLIKHDEAYRVLDVDRSSPAFWEKKKKETMAMIRQYGPCSFFASFSAAEIYWDELLVVLQKVKTGDTNITENDVRNLTKIEKMTLVREDPVTTAWYYHHRFQALMSVCKHKLGPFGKHYITHYNYRKEAQHRGSLHTHAMFWVNDCPKFDANDPSSIEACEEFIDKFITCAKDETLGDLLKRQYHKHTRTCKRGKIKCRFGYPIPPMKRTRILLPIDNDDMDALQIKKLKDEYSDIVNKMEKIAKKDENCTFNEFLKYLDIDEDHYILVIRSTLKQPKVYLKRNLNERKINAYHKILFRLWESNSDLQYVLNSFSTAVYLNNYQNKGQKGMSKLMNELAKELQNGNQPLTQQLRAYVNKFTNAAEISAQEAVCHLLSIDMVKASESCVFINTSPPKERVAMKKSLAELKKLHALNKDSTDVASTGLIDHYVNRPNNMETLTLADFAALYSYRKTFKHKVQKTVETVNGDLSNSDSENNTASDDEITECDNMKSNDKVTDTKDKWIALKNNDGFIKKRTKERVIRFRNYNVAENETNFYREQVMLYYPWRDEENLIANCHQIYTQNANFISQERKKYTHDVSLDLNKLLSQIENIEDDECLDENINISKEFRIFEIGAEENDIGLEIPTMVTESSHSTFTTFVASKLIEDNEYFNLIQKLNEKQRKFHMNLVHLMKNVNNKDKQQFVYIAGAGGVGKSALVEAITQSLMRFWMHQIENKPDDIHIILAGPTGKASFKIKGITLNTAFSLGFNIQKLIRNYTKVDSNKKNTLLVKYQKVKVLVIDEISMVSSDMLHLVNRRLQDIFDNQKPFGGIQVVICLGDFNQLRPVKGNWAFTPHKAENSMSIIANCQTPINNNNNIDNHCKQTFMSSLWSLFKYYELTEIMRQKDDTRFAEALNRLAVGQTTSEDDGLFKSRELSSLGLPEDTLIPNAVALFKTNNDVDNYNEKILTEIFLDGCSVTAMDICLGPNNINEKLKNLQKIKHYHYSKTQGLPHCFLARLDASYMITQNIDTKDGLCNGATGKLKMVIFGITKDGQKVPLRMYLDFGDKNIGQIQRNNMKSIMTKDGADISWTPIERVIKTIEIAQGSLYKITRKQFAMVCAEAVTICKCQGSSYDVVLVGVHNLNRREKYVAFSRATSLNGLYIKGKYVPPQPPDKNDVVYKVLNIMKTESIYEFNLTFPEDSNHSYALYHNIRSLHKYQKHVLSDPNYLHANILMFVETRLRDTDIFDLPNFTCIHRQDCIYPTRHPFGSALYVKTDITSSVFMIEHVCYKNFNDKQKLTAFLDLTAIKLNSKAIIFLYKSPKFSKQCFFEKLESLLTTVKRDKSLLDIIIVGDFNLDHEELKTYMKNQGMFKCIHEPFSTDNYTLIDLLYSSNSDTTAHLYESVISDHKPIWFHL